MLAQAPLPPKPPGQSDLLYIRALLETGQVTPVIDRRYALRELPDALRYFERGHARGKVVIAVQPDPV